MVAAAAAATAAFVTVHELLSIPGNLAGLAAGRKPSNDNLSGKRQTGCVTLMLLTERI